MNNSNGAWIFLREFLRHPTQLGSVIPSSSFLKRRILHNAKVPEADLVVELGPGNGGTTRAMLGAMPANATLLCIELNQELYQLVSRIEDDRLIVHHGNACDIDSILAGYGLAQPDAVISGIPFSCIDKTLGTKLIDSIYKAVKPGGCFVAYQLNPRVSEVNTAFDPLLKTVETVWRNMPPLRIWRWQKP